MPFGFLNIDKPTGMTSHDVVNRVRRLMSTRQVGHAGTLDPLASGVLIVCVGGATRLSDYVMSEKKAYRAVIRLGVETDTYDAEGQIVFAADPEATAALSTETLAHALDSFRGDIQQVPPIYSAIKQGGHKLYDLARKGKTVEIPPRPVTIHQINLVAWQPPTLTLDVTCSAGTYIRSLAHDLGAALGVGGSLAALRRTASGRFRLADAVPLDTLIASEDASSYLIQPAEALADYPGVRVSEVDADHLAHGRTVPCEDCPPDATVMAFSGGGTLVAVCEVQDGALCPRKVFAGAADQEHNGTDNP